MLSAKTLLAKVIHYLEPPPVQSLSQWVAENRVLSSEESSIPGPYNPNFSPFLAGMLDALTDPANETVVIQASTRIGKSFIAQSLIGYMADLDPCPILYCRPRDADAVAFSKSEIKWLFENTLSLANKLAENKGKESSNTLNLKQFPGGSIKLIGMNSSAGLSGFAARLVILDELDRYENITDIGSPAELAIGRTTTYTHNKKILIISSPTVAHTPESKKKSINFYYSQSTQTRYHIPCPHCSAIQPLEWENLHFSHCKETLDDVYYRCANCEGHITEAQKRTALRDGVWIDTYPERRLKGFHINQLYSPFSCFEDVAREWIGVMESRDIFSIRRFKNEVLGEAFEEDLGLYRDSSDTLYNRRERYPVLPLPCTLLTMAVDTQDSWLSYTVAGWGVGREAWVVESGRIDGDPATPGPWEALHKVILKKYRHDSGAELGIDKVLIDTQGHKTTHVNKFLKGKGPTVQGLYGARTAGKPIISKAKRDTTTGLRRWEIGTECAKTDIFQMLTVESPGPSYIHFPWECDEAYFKELYSERKVNGKFKQIGQRRNEKLDELGYNLAAYYICIKNYSMEQRLEALVNLKEIMMDPNEDIEETLEPEPEVKLCTLAESAVERRILPDPIPEPPRPLPPLPTPLPPQTARERYLAKVRGSAGVSQGYQGGSVWDE